MAARTALITGASSGIGAALAREFAAHSHDLVIAARRVENLEALAAELDQVRVEVVRCDLAAPEGADALRRAVDSLGIHVDILVNNAGVAYSSEFGKLEDAEIDNLLALNIGSLTRLSRQFLPRMVHAGWGRILNLASVASFQPVPSMSLYAASKAYVLSLTEGMAEELRGTGVSVTALCPGITRTEMTSALGAEDLPAYMMADAASVAREGYVALMAGEVIRVPGFANQAAVAWAKYQPRWMVRGLAGWFSRINPGRR